MLAGILWIAAQSIATGAPPQRTAAVSTLAVERVSDACPEFHAGDERVDDIVRCQVLVSGTFARLGTDVYYYAFYCIEERESVDLFGSCDDPRSINGGYPRQNIAVFVRHGRAKNVQLVKFAFAPTGDFKRPSGGDYITEPSIVAGPYGHIMELPLITSADCDCNGSLYYLWEPHARQWRYLDYGRWQGQLQKRVPHGLLDENGGWPDLRNMTVGGGLWRLDDPHCCPTGGSYEARLAISNGRFVLKSVKFLRAQ